MKRLLTLAALLSTLVLTGCVVAPVQPGYYPAPVYYPTQVVTPVYVPPPVYIQPAPIYIRPVPACYWTRTWDGYYRTYRNVRVCR